MTKADLIESVHETAGGDLTRKATGEIINTIFSEIATSIATEGKFAYKGFGTFNRRWQKPRPGRNPRTGDPIQIEGKWKGKFSPHTELENTLN
jgi:integration host factor subunit beta